MAINKNNEWFKDWFNSPYYHILYKNRNEEEAQKFIDKLIAFLKPSANARFLDLGCGKGRHSVYLNQKGYSVVGVDLSPESIQYASQFEKKADAQNKSLRFMVQDMRKPAHINYYDYVLNLFTSFGYFENEKDNYATINAVSKALKLNGILVIDFLNTYKVEETLEQNSAETKVHDNIAFKITREFTDEGHIIKNIRFTDQGKEYRFREKVQALTFDDFQKYFAANNFNVLHLFGNYQLEAFDPEESDRLIMVVEKNLPSPPKGGNGEIEKI